MVEVEKELALLEQALATGVSGEQRRVQTALLRETERAQRAAAAGWHWGNVEDPRALHRRVRALPWVAAVVAGVVLGMRWEWLAAAATAGVLLLGLQAALGELTGTSEDVRVFNAPMPAQAVLAYRRAKDSGLFDTFMVYSPRAEDFRPVETA